MSQVTMTLRKAMELENFKLFDFDFQFDDLKMKENIKESILNFYYFYELGSESPEQFLFRFKNRFLRIIPKYNQLYNTTLIDYNPISNYKYKENTTQKNTQNSTSKTEGNNSVTGTTVTDIENNSKVSDYPQQSISGGNFLKAENLDNSKTNNSNTGESTSDLETTSNNTNNSDYEKIVEAMTGTSYQELIKKERENIINIIDMIIEELKPCFILVY